MATYFISDLHLCDETPEITAIFLQFLKNTAIHADALYILGDFFEYWIGDDYSTHTSQQVVKGLYELTSLHIPVYIMHGNRDFLLGKKFITACGATLIADPHKITINGKAILLMHGDTLCTSDIAYLKFRKFVRKKWIQQLFLFLPLWYRQKKVRHYRNASSQYTKTAAAAIMDVTPDAVREVMQQQQITTLIHGHTHKPAIHDLGVNVQRIVLAAWHDQGNALVYHNNGNFEMIYFS